MSSNDWVKTNIFAWGIQAFHCLNLTQSIAVALKYEYAVEYKIFYEKLFSYLFQSDSYLGDLFRDLRKMAESVLDGSGGLDFEDRTFGNLMWPVEEIVFLRAVSGNYAPILNEFLTSQFPVLPRADIEDLISYQRLTTRNFRQSENQEVFLKADWHKFITDALQNIDVNLERKKVHVFIENPIDYKSKEDYAREVVWYGRKGSSLRARNLVANNALVEN